MGTLQPIISVIVSLGTLLTLIGGIFVWVGAKKAGDTAVAAGLTDLKQEVKSITTALTSEIKLIHTRINKISDKQIRLETSLKYLRPLTSREDEDEEVEFDVEE